MTLDNNLREGIYLNEAGIISRKGIYFTEPSEFAKKYLYYVHWGAMDNYDVPYRIDQIFLDAFVLFYIVEGELEFEYRGEIFTAKKNEFVLLDRKFPKVYYSKKPSFVKWFHFSGSATQNFFNYLYDNKGCHFNDAYANAVNPQFDRIFELLSTPNPSDFQLSMCINNILYELCTNKKSYPYKSQFAVTKAMEYMNLNLSQAIQLRDICEYVNFSLFYFTRIFHEIVGMPPHQYLLNLRLLKSKKLIIETDDSIENIAESCGFQSSSHFIRTFKKSNNMTPIGFRKTYGGNA